MAMDKKMDMGKEEAKESGYGSAPKAKVPSEFGVKSGESKLDKLMGSEKKKDGAQYKDLDVGGHEKK